MFTNLIASPAIDLATHTVHRPPSVRRKYLVDIENVVHGPCSTVEMARSAVEVVLAAAPLNPRDLVVVASCHLGVFNVSHAWPNVRYKVRSGDDGADLELLDEIDEHLIERFDELVLVSGDGIFTDAVAWLASRGLPTTVMSHRGSLARSLRMAATEIVYLQEVRVPATPPAPREVA